MANATEGCRHPSQLAVIFSFEDIAGCDGTWSTPGLDAADEALCNKAAGFHICTSDDQAEYLGLSEYDCEGKADSNTFYLTRLEREHRLFGCGNDNHFERLPVQKTKPTGFSRPFMLNLYENKMDEAKYADGPWKLMAKGWDVKSDHIRDRIYKTDVSGGGVMCCKVVDTNKPQDPQPPKPPKGEKNQRLMKFRAVEVLVLVLVTGVCVALTFLCIREIMNWRARGIAKQARDMEREMQAEEQTADLIEVTNTSTVELGDDIANQKQGVTVINEMGEKQESQVVTVSIDE